MKFFNRFEEVFSSNLFGASFVTSLSIRLGEEAKDIRDVWLTAIDRSVLAKLSKHALIILLYQSLFSNGKVGNKLILSNIEAGDTEMIEFRKASVSLKDAK